MTAGLPEEQYISQVWGESMVDRKDMNQEKELDSEWVDLIMEARELGMTPEEIRLFLNQTAESIA
ncbi:anti-repressor SinI family protein [Ammoniphilus sp. 3BR4]|uniref:anti-repressor SinI family protein n=1 Tax=Ammoniphilus sp. 3BR4 TaxID=3158265 RepID=UPI003467E4C3